MAARFGFPIIGIGASAGGVEALKSLFQALPAELDAALVVVTHIGPNHTSVLPAILQDCGALPVLPIEDGQALEPRRAYVLANNGSVTVAGGRLHLRPHDSQAPREPRPIDVFLTSLAEDQGERAAGILLSGSGSDGTLGLKAIKVHGGLTLAQGGAQDGDGSAPAYPEMPQSAVGGGFVDLVLPVEEMPARLQELVRGAGARPAPDSFEPARLAICEVLRGQLGFDFAGYKDKTFFRRVQRRIDLLRLEGLEAYVAHLRHSAEEASLLFRDLLIGVTGFFRDAEAFAALDRHVIGPLLEGRGPADTVRVWVPGCATGEEAYTLAMLLSERAAKLPDPPRLQVFASDIDDAALAVARIGRYPAPLLAAVDPARVARFFTAEGTSYVVSKELRAICIFSAHSVIRDPPFSRIDLVSCRNLLIYMGGVLQDRVMPLFHYALRPGGYLFLGLSETISRHAGLFAAIDKGHRIFRRRDHAVTPNVAALLHHGKAPPLRAASRPLTGPRPADLRSLAGAFVLEQFGPAFVVVDREGEVLHQSARLGKYLEPAAGAPSRQLLALARRGLRLALRGALREALATGRRVVCPRAEVELEDRVQAIELTVAPLPGRDLPETLFVVTFVDLGPPAASERPDSLAGAAEDGTMAQLEREMREMRERLQSTIEEYETATEELKSANEEMVSVNEELQSTNEELETSKEEQQSVNEELRTVNLELSARLEELDRANGDLRNLFESTRIATIFLDRDLLIRSFTPAISPIVNLQQADRGRPLTDFAHRLEQVDFRQEVARMLQRQEPTERRVAMQDSGAQYLMRLLPYRTADGTVDGAVMTFIDVSGVVEAEILATMVAELNHRVRNMLQVVVAVFQRTLRRSTSLEEFATAFRGRVLALARAHEMVSAVGWNPVPLRDLALKELNPYADGKARILLDGPAVAVTPRIALAMGMVLHELATNALKYGALSVPQGHVAISWALEGKASRDLRLRWVEAGGPPVVAPQRRGFGSELIRRQVQHDLHGTVSLDFTPGGLQAELAFPLDGPLIGGTSGPMPVRT